MPRLLKLMFQVPMSSPQMMRILGLLSAACTTGIAGDMNKSTTAASPTPRVKPLVVFDVFNGFMSWFRFVRTGFRSWRAGLGATKSEMGRLGFVVGCRLVVGEPFEAQHVFHP